MRGAKILTSPYLEPHFTLFNIIKSLLGRIAFPRKTKEYSISRVAKTLLSLKTRCFPLLSPCFPLAFPLLSLSLPRNISAEIALPYTRNMRQTHSTSQHCPFPSRYLGVYGTTQYLLHWRGRTARAGGRRGRTARADGVGGRLRRTARADGAGGRREQTARPSLKEPRVEEPQTASPLIQFVKNKNPEKYIL